MSVSRNRDLGVSETQRRRFWNNVRVGPREACWPWQAGTNELGYGKLGIGSRKEKRAPKGDAHWSRLRPERMARGDSNGSRLYPERRLRGELNPQAKLTGEQVRDIRANYLLCRVTQRELGERFGVNRRHVSRIVSGKAWVA